MPSERPFKLLHSALRMDEALEKLQEAQEDLEKTRTKLQKQEKQITELVTKALGEKAVASNSLLVSTRHKFRSLQQTLNGFQRSFEDRLKTLRVRLDGFEDLLRSHNSSEAALEVERSTQCQMAAALQKTLQSLIDERVRALPDEDHESSFVLPEESHGYIPHPLDGFVRQLITVDQMLTHDPDFFAPSEPYRPVSFLEIGCATGRNLLITKLSGLLHAKAHAGFDLDVNLVRRGQQALGLQDELFVADALTFDYAPYDVIFSYRPIRVPEIQRQLEERMVETLRPGAYVIAPLAEDLACYPDMDCLNGPLAIWKKRKPAID
ncbi:class I SAM-dependent methyltransferase [Ruegeria sp. 2205SS24-7]|uniref:class I SAM-dependent methyltransferase n=1 Tax=Ruegeria discodermiae TaxID=3064389 RepID=UPI002740EE5D|nr:class I SAM-dependent methyltransferase [Ruegeria sp. 2205SS24-7]MDP5218394.1 class I SAM-dependent methyltransferase [Ruegeria sp. 2205SS24-7]